MRVGAVLFGCGMFVSRWVSGGGKSELKCVLPSSPGTPVYMQVSMRPKAAMARCGLGMFTRSTLSFTSVSASMRDSCSDRSNRSRPRSAQWQITDGVASSLADSIMPHTYRGRKNEIGTKVNESMCLNMSAMSSYYFKCIGHSNVSELVRIRVSTHAMFSDAAAENTTVR